MTEALTASGCEDPADRSEQTGNEEAYRLPSVHSPERRGRP